MAFFVLFYRGFFSIAFISFNSEDEDCMDCGPFTRHVFTLALGILALLGFLLVLLFQKSSTSLKRRPPVKGERTFKSNATAYIASFVVLVVVSRGNM